LKPRTTSAHSTSTCPTMKVLVTGGRGYVGAKVVDGLAEAGHRALALDLTPDADFRTDVRDSEAVSRAVREARPDAVVHAAAVGMSGSANLALNAAEVRAVNVEGTRNVLEAALKHDVKAIGENRFWTLESSSHVSSVLTSSTNAAMRRGRVLLDAGESEDDDDDDIHGKDFVDEYSRSKLEAERIVLAAAKQRKIRACALRCRVS